MNYLFNNCDNYKNNSLFQCNLLEIIDHQFIITSRLDGGERYIRKIFP